MDVGVDTGCPEDWPDALKEMRTLDNLLRCPICCELINTAMLVPKCSHTYCSLCIRRYSCFKSQCPTCASAVSEPELLNNRLVDEMVSLFQEVRPVLLEVVKGAIKKGVKVSEIRKTKITRKESNAATSDSSWTSIDSKEAKETKQREIQASVKETNRPFGIFSLKGSAPKRKLDTSIFDDDYDDDDVVICDGPTESKKLRTVESVSSSSAPRTPSVNKHQMAALSSSTPRAGSSSMIMSPGLVATPTGHKTLDFRSPPPNTQSPIGDSLASQTPGSSKRVPCPICQAQIPERNINLHLDRCLSSSDKKDGLRSSGKRKLMPKLVYNLIKDGDLRKKLNAVGLPTSGDRQAMINRHKEFTLIYNSECDSLQPRTAEEIVRDMQKYEKSKLKQATMNPVTSLQIKKGASTDEVDKAQKEYVKKHKSQFAQLIAEAKKKMKEKKGQTSTSSTSDDQTNSSSLDVPCASDVQTNTSTEPDADGVPGGSSDNSSSDAPVLPPEDNAKIIPIQDDSSHGSSDLFCDPGFHLEPKDSNNCVQNQVPEKKVVNPNIDPDFDDESNCSNNSESLLASLPAKTSLENRTDDADSNQAAASSDVLRITPVDMNDPISVSSPGIPVDPLSQISDSNDIPLTQASKSSKTGENKTETLLADETAIECASQRSGVSVASTASGSSRHNDGDLSDYVPEPHELLDSDTADIPRRKGRPRRKVQNKIKTAATTPNNIPQRKKRNAPKTSLPENNTSSPSENIDISNLVEDSDFVAKPVRRLRMRKSKT